MQGTTVEGRIFRKVHRTFNIALDRVLRVQNLDAGDIVLLDGSGEVKQKSQTLHATI